MIQLSPKGQIEIPIQFEMETGTPLDLMVRFNGSFSKPLIIMNRSTSSFVNFAAVKQQVNFEKVLDHFDLLEGLKPTRTGFEGPCPFCESENRRAFKASPEKGAFNCFSCEAKGNVLEFVKEMQQSSVRDAALWLVDTFDLDPGKPGKSASPGKSSQTRPASSARRKRPSRKVAKKKVNKPLGFALELDQEHSWFEESGIDPETVKTFGLGYCEKGCLENCIAFPVYSLTHELLGYAGYDLGLEAEEAEDVWRYPTQLDRASVVFGASIVDPTGEGELVLAYDPFDAVVRWQEGEKRLVALCSDTLSRNQLTILESLV